MKTQFLVITTSSILALLIGCGSSSSTSTGAGGGSTTSTGTGGTSVTSGTGGSGGNNDDPCYAELDIVVKVAAELGCGPVDVPKEQMACDGVHQAATAKGCTNEYDAFYLCYQPKTTAANMKCEGGEATFNTDPCPAETSAFNSCLNK